MSIVNHIYCFYACLNFRLVLHHSDSVKHAYLLFLGLTYRAPRLSVFSFRFTLANILQCYQLLSHHFYGMQLFTFSSGGAYTASRSETNGWGMSDFKVIYLLDGDLICIVYCMGQHAHFFVAQHAAFSESLGRDYSIQRFKGHPCS